jgi:DNA polymerase-3 subunit gamma/tau
MALLKEESALAPAETVMRYIRILSELTNQIRYATNKRVMIEIALIKLCKPAMETDTGSLLERVRQLENMVATGGQLTGTVNQAGVSPIRPSTELTEAVNAAPATAPTATPPNPPTLDIGAKGSAPIGWPDILARINMPIMRNHLKGADLSKGADGTWLVATGDDMAFEYLKGHKHELEGVISEATDEVAAVEIYKTKGGNAKNEAIPDLSGIINMEVVIED